MTLHLLAPFILTERLLGALHSAAPARVVTVTSGGMYTQRFDLGDLVMGPEGYDGVVAYARAKRAQVVLTHEWQRRYRAESIDFHVVHPGWADTPGLTEGLPGFAPVDGPALAPARPRAPTPWSGWPVAPWLPGRRSALARPAAPGDVPAARGPGVAGPPQAGRGPGPVGVVPPAGGGGGRQLRRPRYRDGPGPDVLPPRDDGFPT